MNRHDTSIMLGGTSRMARIARTALLTLLLGASALTLAVPAPALAGGTIPNLGTAGSFGVLAGSAVTNTGPTTVRGDLGVSPGTAVSGFPPGIVIGTIHAGDAVAAQAQNDANTAYNSAAGRACDVNLTGQDLGGMTLIPGVYCFSSSAQLTGQLTLDGQGNPNSVFIFQVGSTLTTASNAGVSVINGAQPCRVFWQIGSSATLGTNTHFQGNILALTSITLNTGATTSTGLYALNGAVTLDTNDIQSCAAPGPTATATAIATSIPSATNTSTATATLTAIPATNTSIPTATNTLPPAPTDTAIPTLPAATNTPVNTATATNTSIPVPPSATNMPINTSTVAPSNTPRPAATNTPRNTAVPVNTATNTAIVQATDTALVENTPANRGATPETATTTPTDVVIVASSTVTLTGTPLSTETPGGPSATTTVPVPGDTPTQVLATQTQIASTPIGNVGETPTVAPQSTIEATGTVVTGEVPSPPVLLPPTGSGGGISWLGPVTLIFLSALLLVWGLGMRRPSRMRIWVRERDES